MTWMLRNSRGRRDALLTFSAGAVAVVLVKTLLAGVVAFGVTFGGIDAAVIGALLAPTLGAYGWKRTTVDRDHTVLPPTASVAAPPGLTTRGLATPTALGVMVLLAIGWGLFVFAAVTRGAR